MNKEAVLLDGLNVDNSEKNTETVTIGQTKVFVGENVLDKFSCLVEPYCKNFQVGLVYFDDDSNYARKIAHKLSKTVPSLYELPLQQNAQIDISSELPEKVRFLILIGDETVLELGANYCKDRDLDFAILATTPTTDLYFSFGKSPCLIASDTNILRACPKKVLASGIGIVLSAKLKSFESHIENLFSENGDCFQNVDIDYFDINDNIDPVFLFKMLLKLSEIKSKNPYKLPCEIFADILKKSNKERTLGEYQYMASFVLNCFYQNLLSSEANDVLLPPDRVKTMKLLEKKCGYSYVAQVKNIDIFLITSYFRIKYIMREYRTDLLGELKKLKFETTQRLWRRQYPDAGFWLQNQFSINELLSMMSLAGEFSNGLLGFAKRSGVLEEFI